MQKDSTSNQIRYGSNTLEYSRRLKVATADRFQVGIFWSRHCARQTVFKCSEDCYFHACQDWMLGLDRAGKELFSASHHGVTPGVRAEGRGWRPRQMGFFFSASFGVERSNLENWNQLGTRETLNPPKSSIPYAKVASLWFSMVFQVVFALKFGHICLMFFLGSMWCVSIYCCLINQFSPWLATWSHEAKAQYQLWLKIIEPQAAPHFRSIFPMLKRMPILGWFNDRCLMKRVKPWVLMRSMSTIC